MTKKEMADYLVANQKPLWRSAFYLTKNEDDASDLVQSVFLKALCNYEKSPIRPISEAGYIQS